MSKALLVLVAVAALVTAAAGSAQATKSHAMTFTLDGRIVAADTQTNAHQIGLFLQRIS